MTEIKTIIAKCSGLSRSAYNTTKMKQQCNQIISDEYTDTTIYFTQENDTMYISGPGSVSLRDWSLDFQVWRTNVKYLNDTKVHAGFARIYDAVRNKIHDFLNGKKESLKKIICTGHSLFGAIATIIALDIACMYPELNVYCVTFGSPRVGDQSFVELFNQKVKHSYRCVYKKDPITFTPFPLRFKHVGGLVQYDGAKFKSSMAKFNVCGCAAGDHSMDEYAEKFNPYLNEKMKNEERFHLEI